MITIKNTIIGSAIIIGDFKNDEFLLLEPGCDPCEFDENESLTICTDHGLSTIS